MSDADELVITCIPSLVSVLLRHEQDKSSPLTEEDVLAIRDDCTAVALPRLDLAAITDVRGYNDIDPEYCWEQWQQVRTQLHESLSLGRADNSVPPRQQGT